MQMKGRTVGVIGTSNGSAPLGGAPTKTMRICATEGWGDHVGLSCVLIRTSRYAPFPVALIKLM